MDGLHFTEDPIQPGLSAFIIFVYYLYGGYILSLYILVGDKGGLHSSDFLLFVIVLLLLVVSNLRKVITTNKIFDGNNIILFLFIFYMLFKYTVVDGEIRVLSPAIFIKDIGTNFIAGFIAFSVFESRLPKVSTIMLRYQRKDGIMRLAIIGTLIFFAMLVYLLSNFIGASLADILEYKVLSNEYYQEFGDYSTVAFCCLISLQVAYFKRRIFTNCIYAIYSLVLSVEVILAFLCLQSVNSNKSVLVIALVAILSLYYCKPKYWLINGWKIKRVTFYVIPVIFLLSLLIYGFLPPLDISQLRFFDYGQSSSVISNSSLQVRWDQLMDIGKEQLLNAPILGDLSIANYIHSTIISLQTHMGIIGGLLFWSFILLKISNIYRHDGNEGLRSIALPILFVASISSFFTWGPLWFLIGGLYERTPQSLN